MDTNDASTFDFFISFLSLCFSGAAFTFLFYHLSVFYF
jgi:hypothetical protein